MYSLKEKGFTMIELMVVVAIIGILSAIVIPNYRIYVANTKLVEGTATLMTVRTIAEQFFQDNRTYAGLCTANTPPATQSFTYACQSNASTYTYTATAKAASGINGWAFSINQDNTHLTSSAPSGVTAPTGCWAKKINGTC